MPRRSSMGRGRICLSLSGGMKAVEIQFVRGPCQACQILMWTHHRRSDSRCKGTATRCRGRLRTPPRRAGTPLSSPMSPAPAPALETPLRTGTSAAAGYKGPYLSTQQYQVAVLSSLVALGAAFPGTLYVVFLGQCSHRDAQVDIKPA